MFNFNQIGEAMKMIEQFGVLFEAAKSLLEEIKGRSDETAECVKCARDEISELRRELAELKEGASK